MNVILTRQKIYTRYEIEKKRKKFMKKFCTPVLEISLLDFLLQRGKKLLEDIILINCERIKSIFQIVRLEFNFLLIFI